MFSNFLRLVYTQKTMKAQINTLKKMLPHKKFHKGCQKASKIGIFGKKAGFLNKKYCKI